MTEIPILLLDTGQDGLSAHLPALRALGGGMDYLQVAEAQAALELLEQRRIGVVVADFGAATDDCVTFFQSAAARRPATIRIAVAATLADLTDGLAERGPITLGCDQSFFYMTVQPVREHGAARRAEHLRHVFPTGLRPVP